MWLPMILIAIFSGPMARASSSSLCLPAHQTHQLRPRPIEQYGPWLKQQRIKIVTPFMDPIHLEEFSVEYHKFPADLRHKLLKAGASIHLIHGRSILDDPSWGKELSFANEMATVEGTPLSQVTAAGGVPFVRSPMRIVINSLYQQHGSVNVTLHEMAHSLDSIYADKGISGSRQWQELVADTRVKRFLMRACRSYCADQSFEAFAELFAYYYACDASREKLEQELPQVADYIQQLTHQIHKPRFLPFF